MPLSEDRAVSAAVTHVGALRIRLSNLQHAGDLSSDPLAPRVADKLRNAGRTTLDERATFRVEMHVRQGAGCRKDLDNFVKVIQDVITYTKLVWKDDGQVREIVARKDEAGAGQPTSVEILICPIDQHE